MTSLERLRKNKGVSVGHQHESGHAPWPCPTSEKVLDQMGWRVPTGPQKANLSDNYSGSFSQVTGETPTLLLSYDMLAYGKAGSFFQEVVCLWGHMLVIMYQVVPRRTRALNGFQTKLGWEKHLHAWVVPTTGSNPPPSQKEKPPLLSPHWSESHLFRETTQLEHNGPPLG